MTSFRTYVYIAIALLWRKCDCDLTLLIKKINTNSFNFTCIATEDTAKSAITWLPKDLTIQPQSSFGFNTSISLPGLRELGDSFLFALPPVLDYRWESFPTFIIQNRQVIIHKPMKKIFTINVSILHRSNFTIILQDNKTKICATILENQKSDIDFVACDNSSNHRLISTSYDNSGYKHWKHFTIFKEDGKYRLGQFKKETIFEAFDIKTMEVMSPSGQIKLHNYTIFYGGSNMTTKDDICFLVYPSISCKVFREKYQGIRKLLTKVFNRTTSVADLRGGAPGGSQGPRGLGGRVNLNKWIEVNNEKHIKRFENCMISGVRHCKPNEDRRVLYLETNDTNVACSSLAKENYSINYRIPTEIGNHLMDSVLCNQDMCSCPENRRGTFCETGQNEISNLVCTPTFNNKIKISWRPSNETIDYYRIIYTYGNSRPRETLYNSSCIELCEFILDGINVNLTYNISVLSKIKGVEGLSLSKYCSVMVEVKDPEKVRNLTTETANCELVLNWKYPIKESINGFEITIAGSSQNVSYYFNVTEIKELYTYKNSHLSTGEYNLSILAENIIDKGVPVHLEGIKVVCIPMDTRNTNILRTNIASIITDNIYYVYLGGIIIGFLLIVCCIFVCIKVINVKKKRTNDNDEKVPLQPRNNFLERQHINDILRSWMSHQIFDTHIQEEYNHFDIKNVKSKKLIYGDWSNKKNTFYIQGNKGQKSYVAIECPKNNKMNEAFWITVWDENISTIISLLTDLECMQLNCNYWHNNDSNSITVILEGVNYYTDFQIRHLKITRNGETRTVLQKNYFSWSANQIPVNPISFVRFLKNVKSTDRTSNPILVHGSDKFDRTGTYIMCDYFINYKDDVIKVRKYLEEINKSIPKFSINFQQYKFIYYIIDELNVNTPASINSSRFMDKFPQVMASNITKHYNYIKRREYAYHFLYYVGEEQQPITEPIRVPGFQNEYTFHATSYPMSEDALEFWDYVYSNEITQILVLQNMSQQRGKFWPSETEPLTLGSLTVTAIIHNYDKTMKLLRVSVEKENQKSMEVAILSLRNWDLKNKVPNKSNEFFEFYKTYNNIKSSRDENIMVCCSDGAIGSGVFICFDFLLKKWKREEVFDLVWAVLSIKQRCERFMECMSQHKFMYHIFHHFLNNEETSSTYNEYDIINMDYTPTHDPTYDVLDNSRPE